MSHVSCIEGRYESCLRRLLTPKEESQVYEAIRRRDPYLTYLHL